MRNPATPRAPAPVTRAAAATIQPLLSPQDRELANAYGHGTQPQRSVVFLDVTAEEKGLLGSEYYAANPLYPLATTVGVLNMDALDPHGPARNFTPSDSARLDLLDDTIAVATHMDISFSTDPKPEAGHFFPAT